jgi:hypothetical protein
MKRPTIKPMLLSYDWKESPEQVVEDLEPILKRFGVYFLQDPLSIGSDSAGYILTDNPKMTIGEYKKLCGMEFDDVDDWLPDMMTDAKLTDKDPLEKLIRFLS